MRVLAEESIDRDLVKTPKYLLLELLRILNHFYSFRELERKIEVPMQTLWKYHTLRTIPEKETAVKILRKIKESRIIENTLYDVLSSARNPLEILGNPGVLELAAYLINDYIKQYRLNAIVSMPDNYSSIISAILASKNRLKLCLAGSIFAPPNSICTALVGDDNKIIPLCYPRSCLVKKQRIALICSVYIPKTLSQLVLFLHKNSQIIEEIIFVYGNKATIEEDLKTLKDLKPRYKILFAIPPT